MRTTNFDLSQFLLFNNTTDNTGSLTNATGSTITLYVGTLMGRIAATGLLVAQVSTATDGSQVPIGACCANYTILDGTTQVITLVRSGEVASSFIRFGGSDTLATSIVDNSTKLGTIGDILAGKGLFLKGATNLTYVDAQ